MAIDRAKLTVVVDLASDTSVADAQERDRILNRLYEQIESVRTEGVSSGLSDAPLDTKYTTLVVAAGQGPVDYLLARRRSYARFRGAQAAGDSELMAKQWTATRKYAALAAQRLLTQAKLDEDAAAILEKVSFALRRPPDRAALYLERLKREGLSTEHRKLLQKSGLGPEEIDAYQKVLQATPPGQLGLSIMELHTSVGQFRRALATSLERSDGVGPEPLSLTYFVGNPHERQETIDLFIRPISIPSDWKLSIVNSGQPQRQAPRGDDARQFPVSAIEAGKHYAVTLPAKGQVKVDSVLVPVGEIGAHTTARWAVEGKIRDELIGGMVHETNAPYLVADLKLPAVGSKEEEEIELPAARRMPSTVIVAVSAGVVILASFALLIWKRRRRARGLP